MQNWYNFFNHDLLSAFVERRHASSFHLSIGDISMTLNDVSPLMHLSTTRRLLNYSKITKLDALDMMMKYLGAIPDDAHHEIHELVMYRFGYLKGIPRAPSIVVPPTFLRRDVDEIFT